MNPYSPPGAATDTYSTAAPAYAAVDPANVSEAAVDLLRSTRPWVILLSVLAFMGSGVMVAVGLIAVGYAVLAPGAKSATAALGLVYVPLAAVYVYPGVKLWSYGAAIARLIVSRSSTDLEKALGHQKSFWKFSGIASLVVIALYAIGIAVLIAFGALAALGIDKLGR